MSAVGDGPGWEHLPHGADIGVRGRGATMSQAFAEAGRALTAVTTDPARVEPRDAVAICCAASEPALLLYDWLNALVFEMATRRMLFSRFEVEVRDDGRALVARVFGEPVDRARHAPAVEVKGATLTGLEVARLPAGGWRAECIVDV